MDPKRRAPGAEGIRAALLALLLLGLLGSLAELLLLAHDEDLQQFIPIGLIGAGLAVVPWNLVRASPASLRTLQVLMAAFIGAGLLGIYFHLEANTEFQREMDPALSGSALLWSVLQAKSPPALAPGLMVQFGLLGLICSWGHPAFRRRLENSDHVEEGART